MSSDATKTRFLVSICWEPEGNSNPWVEISVMKRYKFEKKRQASRAIMRKKKCFSEKIVALTIGSMYKNKN